MGALEHRLLPVLDPAVRRVLGGRQALAGVAGGAAELREAVLLDQRLVDLRMRLVGVLREVVLERGVGVLVHAHVAGDAAVEAVQVRHDDLLDLERGLAHLLGLGLEALRLLGVLRRGGLLLVGLRRQLVVLLLVGLPLGVEVLEEGPGERDDEQRVRDDEQLSVAHLFLRSSC
jgi:hypothetical protein